MESVTWEDHQTNEIGSISVNSAAWRRDRQRQHYVNTQIAAGELLGLPAKIVDAG